MFLKGKKHYKCWFKLIPSRPCLALRTRGRVGVSWVNHCWNVHIWQHDLPRSEIQSGRCPLFNLNLLYVFLSFSLFHSLYVFSLNVYRAIYIPKAANLVSKCLLLLLVLSQLLIKLMCLSSNFALATLAKKDNRSTRCFSYSELYSLLQSCGGTLEGGLRKLHLHQRVLWNGAHLSKGLRNHLYIWK